MFDLFDSVGSTPSWLGSKKYQIGLKVSSPKQIQRNSTDPAAGLLLLRRCPPAPAREAPPSHPKAPGLPAVALTCFQGRGTSMAATMKKHETGMPNSVVKCSKQEERDKERIHSQLTVGLSKKKAACYLERFVGCPPEESLFPLTKSFDSSSPSFKQKRDRPYQFLPSFSFLFTAPITSPSGPSVDLPGARYHSPPRGTAALRATDGRSGGPGRSARHRPRHVSSSG